MKNIEQRGQVIIILLLILLVALSIGLALTQRSVTDVATSTQAEQSTRAFSAAEAGIEKALSSPLPLGYVLPLDNNSSAVVDTSGWLPYAANVGIEYPAIGRETTAHFWFLDPAAAAPTAFYTGTSFDLYYGNPGSTDTPAVEVKVVTLKNNNFYTKNYYFDSSSTRTTGINDNNFTYTGAANCDSGAGEQLVNGILGANRQFMCKQLVGTVPDPTNAANPCNAANSCVIVLARIRFLYINENHRLALAPSTGAQFPPQVQIYNALGTSGQSQKQIQAFKVRDVVLPWFDFAIFSTNEIRK